MIMATGKELDVVAKGYLAERQVALHTELCTVEQPQDRYVSSCIEGRRSREGGLTLHGTMVDYTCD